jgi:hypothetical protein
MGWQITRFDFLAAELATIPGFSFMERENSGTLGQSSLRKSKRVIGGY